MAMVVPMVVVVALIPLCVERLLDILVAKFARLDLLPAERLG